MVLPLLYAVLKWDLLSDLPSLYGRRLCRTIPACCTGTTCLNIRVLSHVRGREYFSPFSGKNQKPNLAHKCPITAIQIRTSQKLSEFSCNTFEPLNRGRPPFWPQILKITSFGHGEYTGGGGGEAGYTGPASLLSSVGGRGRGGGGESNRPCSTYNLNACKSLFLISPFC
jgi:hypothetical protein